MPRHEFPVAQGAREERSPRDRAKLQVHEARRELVALKRSFHFTKGNHKPKKIVMWIALTVWAVAATAILLVPIVTGRDVTLRGESAALWTLLNGFVFYLLGSIKENERLRG